MLDSTPLLDAVATQDTVTQLRAAIRKLLTVAEQSGELELAAAVRAVLARDDEYATVGKPPCDRDDKGARDELVDALVRDADAALTVLHGRGLTARWVRPPSCWRWSPAKTSTPTNTGRFVLRGESRGTG